MPPFLRNKSAKRHTIPLLADTLAHRVAEFISREKMLAPADRVGVAVSGGADSLVLLHLLHRLRSHFAIDLVVLHVNHQLRGAESAADEDFVRSIAASLGLDLVAFQGPVPPGNLEQEARDIRRAFFREAKAKYNLHRIALGHTLSDQAETVLFRLLRGSGLAGLAGMRPVTSDTSRQKPIRSAMPPVTPIAARRPATRRCFSRAATPMSISPMARPTCSTSRAKPRAWEPVS